MSDQYYITVLSFKKTSFKKHHPPPVPSINMDSSFSSSMSQSQSSQYGPPLDYSFRNLSSLANLERSRPPRQSLRKQVPALPLFFYSTVKLSNCQTVKLSNCQTVKLSNCQTVKLSNCQLSNCQTVKWSKWSNCQTVKLSNCQTVKIVKTNCQTFRLSNCQTVKLF
jgi:uncharacterized protein YjbI with pentapeptide repeats